MNSLEIFVLLSEFRAVCIAESEDFVCAGWQFQFVLITLGTMDRLLSAPEALNV